MKIDQDTYVLEAAHVGQFRYFAKEGEVFVQVSVGTKGDGFQQERDDICQLSASERKKLHPRHEATEGAEECDESLTVKRNNQHYTYVAMWFVSLYAMEGSGKDTWLKTKKWHHITLAYLPLLTEKAMADLQNAMNSCIRRWWELLKVSKKIGSQWLAESRSRELLPMRKIDIIGTKTELREEGGEEDIPAFHQWPGTDLYTIRRSKLGNLSKKELEGILTENKARWVTTPKYITDSMLKEKTLIPPRSLMINSCVLYWRRDVMRQQYAEELEMECMPIKNIEGVVEVKLKGHGVEENSQIRTLLEYLKDIMIYQFGAYHLKPLKEVGIFTEQNWHVTPQVEKKPWSEHAGKVLFNVVSLEESNMWNNKEVPRDYSCHP